MGYNSLTAPYPTTPGVYLMKNREGDILYVGKAKNLKTRLKTYFSTEGDRRPMIPYLMSQVDAIETMITLTERDALILEHQLIQRHRPKYNILLKDDKSLIRVILTQHRWPMLKLLRSKEKKPHALHLFGPYPNASYARNAITHLQRLLPLRQCSDGEFAARTRPCILYEMHRCAAPCVNLCSQKEYDHYVERAVQFLSSSHSELVLALKEEMKKASEALEFERAAELLQAIQEIEHAQVSPIANLSIDACDVLGIHRAADTLIVSQLIVRHGAVIAAECFSFHLIVSDDQEAIESFLMQHYAHASQIPQRLLSPVPCHPSIQDLLSEVAQTPVTIETPKKGKGKRLLDMGQANAKSFFEQEQKQSHLKEDLLMKLQETCELTRFPRCIDCLDTSHIAGGDAVASIVSFVEGKPDPTRSRLFHIRLPPGQVVSDLYSMRQAMHRYFSNRTITPCDLFIVDGGKGQLGCALDLFQELKIASIDLIALTKEEGRHDRGLSQEQVYLPYRQDPILLPARSPLLFFLQTIRDEAHRRAVSFHVKKRKQRIFTSALDSLKGIGPIKKRALLHKFGSVQRIQKATRQELEEIKVLRPKDIENILRMTSPPAQ